MDINLLVKLTSRAWSLSILAQLHEGTPGRQARLVAATGAGRTAFGQSLTHLMALGLLERNPGHGHPLRPEFRLTEKGTEIAAIASQIKRTDTQPESQILLRRSWTIPILVASRKPRFFSDIKRELGSITDRALSKSIVQLQAQDWMAREVSPVSRPPRPIYQATNAGAEIGRVVAATLS